MDVSFLQLANVKAHTLLVGGERYLVHRRLRLIDLGTAVIGPVDVSKSLYLVRRDFSSRASIDFLREGQLEPIGLGPHFLDLEWDLTGPGEALYTERFGAA